MTEAGIPTRDIVAKTPLNYNCFVNTYWSMGFIVLLQLYYAVAPPIRGLSRLTA